jgi:predicted  nucleic acid-binding Zn-ribbon protein
MALAINGSTRTGSVGSQNQINMLLSQIKGLRKQLAALRKKLGDSTDPAEQKMLMKEIMDLQRLIEMQEQQIANIQREDQRKQQQRDKVNGTKAA